MAHRFLEQALNMIHGVGEGCAGSRAIEWGTATAPPARGGPPPPSSYRLLGAGSGSGGGRGAGAAGAALRLRARSGRTVLRQCDRVRCTGSVASPC
jgi:hypothetical protein